MDLPLKLFTALRDRLQGSGKLLTPLLEWELDFTFRYCCFLKICPYDWKPKQGLLTLTSHSRSHIGWSVVATLFLIHCVLMWLNLFRCVFKGDHFTELTLSFFGCAAYSVPSLAQTMIYLHMDQISQFFNRHAILFKQLERKTN